MASFLELLSWGEVGGEAEETGSDWGSPGLVKSVVIHRALSGAPPIQWIPKVMKELGSALHVLMGNLSVFC